MVWLKAATTAACASLMTLVEEHLLMLNPQAYIIVAQPRQLS